MKKIILTTLIVLMAGYCMAVEPAVVDRNQAGKTIGYSALTVTSKGSVGGSLNPLNVIAQSGTNTLNVNATIVTNPVTVTWTAGLVGLDLPNGALKVGVMGFMSSAVDTSGVLIFNSGKHAEEHRGKAYVFGNTLSAIATASPLYIGFVVPNGVTIHVQTQFVAVDGSYVAQLFAGSWGALGTTLTSYTVNKTLSTVSGVMAYEGVNTITAVASRPPFEIGASATGGGVKSGGNVTAGDDDYVILGAGKYFWKITAITASVTGSYEIPYYTE